MSGLRKLQEAVSERARFDKERFDYRHRIGFLLKIHYVDCFDGTRL